MPRSVVAYGPHGRQPFADCAERQRWTYVQIGAKLGVSARHVRNAAIGWTRPNAVLREELPSLLGCPLSELFTESAIAEDFATRPKRKAEAS
ncbi:hypothetical protein SAMN05444374_1187 [Rhodococcoides kroppenstedtii]|uniref:HTH cro/C1-type domain-containing protein n=1 Tax=Rhodococcoides kroppenstedtii TaxID=293050 RepID=A0A1I0UCH0_9NOCA|nr:hypothetical protein SAMN05444374_1187 [Rhodococcus kroppenstedtii]